MVDKKRGKASKAGGSSKKGKGKGKTPAKSEAAAPVLTPKRVGADNFGLDGFNMDSPFVDFCNGMLSPITPSKGKTSFNLGGIENRSPMPAGNWTPDLMALFNGKGGDFLNMANSCLDGTFLPNGTPLDKMIAEQKGNQQNLPNMDAGNVVGKKKEDAKKGKKPGKDPKGSRNTRETAANKGKASEASLKGKASSKASSKSQKAQNKLSSSPARKGNDALNKKKLDESAKYRTPKQTKKAGRGPSRCLDFGFSSVDQSSIDPNFFSPTNTMTTEDSRRLSTSDLMPKTPSDPTLDPPKATSTKRRRSSCNSDKCNCKKSKCLKLYCECFAAGRFCKDCLCQNCGNLEWNKKVVEETRKSIMQRDPLAFQPKILKFADKLSMGDDGAPRHKKGCHCKRSHCLKKYCECFQAGIKCSDLCRCEDCHNKGEPAQATTTTTTLLKRAAPSSLETPNKKKVHTTLKRVAPSTPTQKKTPGLLKRASPSTPNMKRTPTLLKRVAPYTPSQKKTIFQIRGSILRPPPSPLDICRTPTPGGGLAKFS